MERHFIHYLARNIRGRIPNHADEMNKGDDDKAFYADEQSPEDGFERPMYHMTRRQKGPVTRIEKGDVIWLFSTLQSPWGTLPPSLDARIIVEEKEVLEKGRVKFHAGKNSQWFPLYDAKKKLTTLRTVDEKGGTRELWPDPEKPLGLYLESIRQLTDAHGLDEWSGRILNAEFDFISYRIKDGTRQAFETAKCLLQRKQILFWDRFSLPRRLVERRELVSNEMLDKYLMEKIKASSSVWGIETPEYFALNSYSQKEASLAKQLSKYQSVQVQ